VVVAPSASAAVEVVTVQVIPPTATIQPTVNIRAPTTDAVGTNPLSFATQSPATTAVDKVKDISVDRRPEETRQEYSTQNTAVVPSNAVTDAIRIKTKFIDPISQNLALSQPQQGEMSTTGSASRSVPNLHANQIGIAPVNM
jgi:hypothetical protein